MSLESVTFTLGELCEASGGRLVRSGRLPSSRGVCIDSRKVSAGVLFVGVRGENFDGSDYAAKAAESGASIVIVEEAKVEAALSTEHGAAVVAVESGVRALGLLASWHRQRIGAKVVAITGSNGKTTTKEMTASILQTCGKTQATQGNLNNEFGAPLTLLGLESDDAFAVIELGMNHEGEIARLARIVRPDVGVVTNVAAVHIEHFPDGLEGVSHAKGELFHGLSLDAVSVANADDPLVMRRALAAGRKTRTFGRSPGADLRLVEILSHDARGIRFRVEILGEEEEWTIPVVGLHNALNACAAAAAALSLGVSRAKIREGLQAARPPGRRLRLSPIEGSGATLLDDCYNANPASTLAALKTLSELAPEGHRVAVLGDMRELGPQEESGHREVGEAAAVCGLKLLVAFGPASRALAAAAIEKGLDESRVLVTETPAEAASRVRVVLSDQDIVLVKASRGTRLERVSDLLSPPTAEVR